MKNLVDVAKNYKGNKLDFIHGAEWMQAVMIAKAVKFVHENYDGYDGADFERDLQKFMEE